MPAAAAGRLLRSSAAGVLRWTQTDAEVEQLIRHFVPHRFCSSTSFDYSSLLSKDVNRSLQATFRDFGVNLKQAFLAFDDDVVVPLPRRSLVTFYIFREVSDPVGTECVPGFSDILK